MFVHLTIFMVSLSREPVYVFQKKEGSHREMGYVDLRFMLII